MDDTVLKAVFAIGVLGLAVALLVPTLVDATQDDARQHIEMYENDTRDITDRLSFYLQDVNGTSGNATVELRDDTNFNNQTRELSSQSTNTIQLSGSNVTVDTQQVYDNDTSVRFVVDYPPTFGWSDGPAAFMSNIGLIIVLITGIMFTAIVGMIIR